jgi:ornithine carbamoyltransferase
MVKVSNRSGLLGPKMGGDAGKEKAMVFPEGSVRTKSSMVSAWAAMGRATAARKRSLGRRLRMRFLSGVTLG